MLSVALNQASHYKKEILSNMIPLIIPFKIKFFKLILFYQKINYH